MATHILELGTHAFTLHHARMAPSGDVVAVRQFREEVGLEPAFDATGAFGRRGIAGASAAMDTLLALARRTGLGAPVVAVATPPIAAARDAQEFVRVVRRRFGLTPWMLSTSDAAHVAYRGARHSQPGAGAGVVVHLGESTIDFGAGFGDACEAAETITLGLSRLHRAYGVTSSGLSPADAGALFSLVRLCAGPAARRTREWGDAPLTAASPSVVAVLALARALGYLAPHAHRIERVALQALAADVLARGAEGVVALGVPEDRAVLAGTTAVVLDAIADLVGQREITLAATGLVEGAALASWEAEASVRRASGDAGQSAHVPFSVA